MMQCEKMHITMAKVARKVGWNLTTSLLLYSNVCYLNLLVLLMLAVRRDNIKANDTQKR